MQQRKQYISPYSRSMRKQIGISGPQGHALDIFWLKMIKISKKQRYNSKIWIYKQHRQLIMSKIKEISFIFGHAYPAKR